MIGICLNGLCSISICPAIFLMFALVLSQTTYGHHFVYKAQKMVWELSADALADTNQIADRSHARHM